MGSAGRFIDLAEQATRSAAKAVGISDSGLELIRSGERAVLRLDGGRVVARVERSPARRELAAREVRVARWLASEGVRVGEPLPGPQPVEAEGMVVTFWDAIDGEWTVPAELARLLRRLHETVPPDGLILPDLDPFDRTKERILAATALSTVQRDHLLDRLDALTTLASGVEPILPRSVIHGDANIGNLLATEHGTVLFDLDGVCWGPPEWDLVLTALYTELGWHSEAEYADFCTVYGFDVTAWGGYGVFKAVRELRMTTWLAQKAGEDPRIDAEIHTRIADLADPGRPRNWQPY